MTKQASQNGYDSCPDDTGRFSAASPPLIIIVMGVSGCGKSTQAQALASRLGVSCMDADDLHPAANIEKMSAGIALNDEDRWPWLQAVARAAADAAASEGISIIACSALRKAYRDLLCEAGQVYFVYLHGSQELIAARMHLRAGHYMPESLLDSQFATLEDPRNEPGVITVDIDDSPTGMTHKALQGLLARGALTCPD